ncbi:uncharacterized protein SAPINGB_P004215 [Magnusiomyces paraingens]|uniref:Protein kinase domain-containing protein n=1 Tax=Magnusiomyces paraingens TaxID=2606893 RepID=A0A5E8C0T7_9ASCO|nr:uncharacterized protein SAPINGB_P004215 [Saprochaete ingens]VVT54715.1 unnamed protein product [Saprochaete ingens]
MTVFESIKNLIRNSNNNNTKQAKQQPASSATSSSTSKTSTSTSTTNTNTNTTTNSNSNTCSSPTTLNSVSPAVPSESPISMLSASPPSKAAPPVVTTTPAVPDDSHHHHHHHHNHNTNNNNNNNNNNSSQTLGQQLAPHSSHSSVESSHIQASAALAAAAAHHAAKTSSSPYPGLDPRYKLVEKMGDGAFSVVYKALDTQTGENVAIKVVNKHNLSTSQRSSILKEVAIMRQLHHKNIVELLGFIDAVDYYYIILELLPGGELFHQIVRLTYFSEDLARHVIVQVAEAIRYLHEEAGVVHRDIKPENLLFYPAPFIPSPVKQVRAGEDAETKQDEGVFVPGVGAGGIGVIKLADFGLSKIIWDANTMTPCGTVGYTAPEIVNDQRYSKSVDMWALGCVLYTILCGFPPFYDENIQVLTEKVARGEYTFLSPWWDEISKGAKDLVSHLLTVDPSRRYTIEQFLAHPWITQSNKPTVPAVDSPLLKPLTLASEQHQVEKLVAEEAAINAGTVGSSYFAKVITTPATEDLPPVTSLNSNTDNNRDSLLPTSGLNVPEGFADKTFMSPAVVAMKEAFEVFNSVHRSEEEKVTQQRVRGVRGSGGAKSAKKRGQLGRLGEEEEEEDEDEDEEKEEESNGEKKEDEVLKNKLDKLAIGSTNEDACDDKFFELSLEGSTLIERRKRVSSSGSVAVMADQQSQKQQQQQQQQEQLNQEQ